MKPWLYRHRTTILIVYSALALTTILALQLLEVGGVIR